MQNKGGIFDFLSAEELNRLGRTSIGSRFTAEGMTVGAHKSRRKGVSVEFADYRQYTPGDDIKHLDWKAYGRKERLYVREYEEETGLRVHLLVDASSSMGCSFGGVSKFRFASTLAAAMAYIVIHNNDSAGLALFDSKCRTILPPKNGPEHLRSLCDTLSAKTPSEKTDLASSLHSLAEQTRRRGLIVIFSDLFDDMDKIRSALAHFRRKMHDVIVYQILDRSEIEFPFRDSARFRDPETGEMIVANPKDVRADYMAAFGNFLAECRNVCSSLGVDYQTVLTDQSPVDFLVGHSRRRALAGR